MLYNRIIMRYVLVSLIVILIFHGQIFAQERDTLIETIAAPDKSGALPEYPVTKMPDESASMPVLFKDLTGGFGDQNFALPVMNFNLTNGWKTETGTLMDFRSINGFPFMNNPPGLFRRSVWDIYQGTYGIRTYQVNNKLSVGTAGYSDKSFNTYSVKSGIYPQTNYGSSLFVGYKFSEKFSISAGFTIQRNGDPMNRNQGMQNGGIFP